MYWTPYVIPHIAAAAISAFAAALAWQRRRFAASRVLLWLAAATFCWSAANAFELCSVTLDAKSFWVGLQYPGIVSVSVLWFLFGLHYTGRDHWLTPRRLALLAAIPAISLVLVATNSWHGLMRYDIALDTSGPFSVITKRYGPWFYVNAAYSHTLLLVGTAVLAESLVRSHYMYRMQGLSFLIAALLPFSANLAYIFGHSPIARMDLTPPAIAVSGLVVVLSVYRFRTLDLVPAARSQVVDSISDGVLVLDEQARIVDMNPAATTLLALTPKEAIGRAVTDVLGEIALTDRLTILEEARPEIHLTHSDGETSYEVSIAALRHRGRVSGWVVVLRDVTERRQAEQEREALIGELQEALKRIRTLRGLIPICASCKKIRDDQGYWRQVEDYVRAHSEADFTHAICPDCLAVLYPDVSEEV